MLNKELRDTATVNLIASLFLLLRNRIEESLNEEAEKRGGLDEEDLPEIISSVIQKHMEVAKSYPYVTGFDEALSVECKSRYGDSVNRVKNEVFGDLPFGSSGAETLIELANEMLCRAWFGPMKSGLVVAGFGEDEYVPSLINYELEEMAMDLPRYSEIGDHQATHGSSAAIIPFAQLDMVQSFMEGIQL